MSVNELKRLRAKYGGDKRRQIKNEKFRRIAEHSIDEHGTRAAPYAGIPTFLSAPQRVISGNPPDFGDLQVALIGVPMDLGASNRSGARFGPRALRAIERIGPYNHALGCSPILDLRVADIGDVTFRSRFKLELCHEDIERYFRRVVMAGVASLAVGGDHSISYPILKAIAQNGRVGLIHIDAHCDTAGEFDQTQSHHGASFRLAVLDGLIDPKRTIQIGIRGSAEYLWEFSSDSGMAVIHAEELDSQGVAPVIGKAREVIGDGPAYVSFDIDSLDPAFAPGTGTPEVGGLTPREVLAILRGLKGLDIVGGDVVEVAPQFDATTNTAHVGAQMLFEILSLMVFSPSIRRGS